MFSCLQQCLGLLRFVEGPPPSKVPDVKAEGLGCDNKKMYLEDGREDDDAKSLCRGGACGTGTLDAILATVLTHEEVPLRTRQEALQMASKAFSKRQLQNDK